MFQDTPIHGEFTSADARALTEANARFTLYRAGSTYTLTSTDVVVVCSLQLSTVTAMTVQVYDGANNSVAAGENIFRAVVAANANEVGAYFGDAPHVCQAGTHPKVISDTAGQIYAKFTGYIVPSGRLN